MTLTPDERAAESRRTMQLVGWMDLMYCWRVLIKLFPDQDPKVLRQIMEDYTGFSTKPDFEYRRGRAKILNQLAQVLSQVRRDPDLHNKIDRILQFDHQMGRVIETRRAFRVHPNLAWLILKLISHKSPLKK